MGLEQIIIFYNIPEKLSPGHQGLECWMRSWDQPCLPMGNSDIFLAREEKKKQPPPPTNQPTRTFFFGKGKMIK